MSAAYHLPRNLLCLLLLILIAPAGAQDELPGDTRPFPRPIDPSRFIDQGEYVEDKQTGLLWQKDGEASGKLNYYQATDYAKALKLGGLEGWRVPTRDEIAAIFPAAEPFTNTSYKKPPYKEGAEGYRTYWTSELQGPDYGWVFQWYYKGGANNCTASTNFCYVRCVRNKESASPPQRKMPIARSANKLQPKELETNERQPSDPLAEVLADVGHDDRERSDRAMLLIRKIGPAALPSVRKEYERTKRRLLELEILLGNELGNEVEKR